MARQTELNCPSCGAQIEIANRFVHLAVCQYCNAAVLVDEKVARIAGQMATLPAEDMLLFVGATGTYRDRAFTVLGRVRYGYSRGYWDEWFVSFEDGGVRWITVEGDEYLLEKHAEAKGDQLKWDDIRPGQLLRIGKEKFQVREKDVATCEGGEGQLPFAVLSGEQVPYVDLHRKGASGTLEFEEGGVRIFCGRPINRARLHLDRTREEAGVGSGAALPTARAETEGAAERVVRGQEDRSRKVNCRGCGAPLELPPEGTDRIECNYCGNPIRLGGTVVNCPDCGGSLPLQADHHIQMIHCAYCGAQLDITNPAEPDLLEKVLLSEKPDVPFKLGQTCTFDDVEYEIVGHVRCEEREGWERWFWDDFLLYSSQEGYRWLSLEKGHATLAWKLDEEIYSLVPENLYPKKGFRYDGRQYKVFEVSQNLATMTYVDGELPWVAKVGDPANYGDAISPPLGLTVEWSGTEIEYFQSRYVSREELTEAFDPPPQNLPSLEGVAPTQPFVRKPWQKQLMAITAAFGILFLVFAGLSLTAGTNIASFQIDRQTYLSEGTSESFEIKQAPTLCQAKFDAPLKNSWIYLQVALLDKDDRPLLDFSKELSYYYGRSGGESWSEGSRKGSSVFRVKEPGTYRFLVRGQVDGGPQVPVNVTVYQGVLLTRYFLILAILSLAYPAAEIIRKLIFEGRRWAPVQEDEDED